MKKAFLFSCLSALFCFLATIPVNGQDIYRLIDPIYGGRYGKSPTADPPFLRFGSAQQYYHIAASKYNSYTTAVSNSFNSWNNAGSVKFSSSSSSGLSLETYWDNYGSPGIVNPGYAYPADDDFIIDVNDSYVRLNTFHTWGTQQDIENDRFDVETIFVHEVGHIHGLAHPLTSSYTHNSTAPIMAGGDNQYYWNHTARSLKTADVNGTKFLQNNVWVPEQCATIQTGINNSFSGVTVHVASGTYSGGLRMDWKSDIDVIGSGIDNTIITGYVMIYDCSNIDISNITSSSIHNLYNLNSTFTNVKCIQSFSVDGGNFVADNLISTNSYYWGIITAELDNGVLIGGEIKNKSESGFLLELESNILFINTVFCNNNYDVEDWDGGGTSLINCYFSSSTPGGSLSGYNIYYNIWQYCGSMPKKPSNLISSSIQSVDKTSNKDKPSPGDADYEKLVGEFNKFNEKLAKSITKDNNDKKFIEKYIPEYEDFATKFNELSDKYAGTDVAKKSLKRVVNIYRILGKQNDAKLLLSNKEKQNKNVNIKSNIKKMLLPLLFDDRNFEESLKLCDELLVTMTEEKELASVMYKKGMILHEMLKEKERGIIVFDELIKKYPNSGYAKMASVLLDQKPELQKDVNNTLETPTEYKLQGNYPNPFNPSTTISYSIPQTSNVEIQIFDMMGREVRSYEMNGLSAGNHSQVWDGTNSNGSIVSSGIYFYKFRSVSLEGNGEVFEKTAKLIMLK